MINWLNIINTAARLIGQQHRLAPPAPAPVLYYAVTICRAPRDWEMISFHRSRWIAELYAAEHRDALGYGMVLVQPVMRICHVQPVPSNIPPVKRWIG